MGAGGEDVQLSPLARSLFGYTVECKNRAAIAVYKDYEQAKTHGLVEPLVILKQNNSKPLALVDADHFFDMVQKINDLKHQVDIMLLVKGNK
jgi:alpha/beta superfamily hydrolase